MVRWHRKQNTLFWWKYLNRLLNVCKEREDYQRWIIKINAKIGSPLKWNRFDWSIEIRINVIFPSISVSNWFWVWKQNWSSKWNCRNSKIDKLFHLKWTKKKTKKREKSFIPSYLIASHFLQWFTFIASYSITTSAHFSFYSPKAFQMIWIFI